MEGIPSYTVLYIGINTAKNTKSSFWRAQITTAEKNDDIDSELRTKVDVSTAKTANIICNAPLCPGHIVVALEEVSSKSLT